MMRFAERMTAKQPQRFRQGLYRLRRPALLLLMSTVLLAGCRRNGGTAEKAQETNEAETDEPAPVYEGDYPGTIAVRQQEEASPYYGIMYATVLDIDGRGTDSTTVYSFKDQYDPDNAWAVTGLEIGDIETELKTGQNVAILFHGDMVKDSENVEFLVILPEGSYELKRVTGVTTANMMSTFTVETADHQEIHLTKDNCRIDDGALSKDSGETVIVYYADGGEQGCYPLRVFKGN